MVLIYYLMIEMKGQGKNFQMLILRPVPPQANAFCKAGPLQAKLEDEKSMRVQRLQKPCKPRGDEYGPDTKVTARIQRRNAVMRLMRVQKEDGLVQSSMRRQCCAQPPQHESRKRIVDPSAVLPHEENVRGKRGADSGKHGVVRTTALVDDHHLRQARLHFWHIANEGHMG